MIRHGFQRILEIAELNYCIHVQSTISVSAKHVDLQRQRGMGRRGV